MYLNRFNLHCLAVFIKARRCVPLLGSHLNSAMAAKEAHYHMPILPAVTKLGFGFKSLKFCLFLTNIMTGRKRKGTVLSRLYKEYLLFSEIGYIDNTEFLCNAKRESLVGEKSRCSACLISTSLK